MKTPKEKDIKNYLTINEYEHLRKFKICRDIRKKTIQETSKQYEEKIKRLKQKFIK